MTADTTPRTGEVVRTNGSGPVPIRAEVVEAYEAMFAQVPDAGGDGMSAILEQLANAGQLADLDAPWRSDGLGEYIGERLVVTGIRKAASDFVGGLPWFLVVEAGLQSTGEKVTFTTGAVSVVAQLVKAWSMGAFPLVVIPRQAARPTRDGYYPQHLEIRGQLRQADEAAAEAGS